ncbi:hypothetical protein [Paenibacillus humicola]|uniref:hypothetical protein n=1 Tax=Paenibacillus humicola TaxID=3110540 RepID=UPI00237B056F|nr:hypothetical protein [Paenibacillus humicola]
MAHEQNEHATKAEVQSTELNKMPVAGDNDAEFAAEEANENEANANQANRQQTQE